jgi:hypothetical protein
MLGDAMTPQQLVQVIIDAAHDAPGSSIAVATQTRSGSDFMSTWHQGEIYRATFGDF